MLPILDELKVSNNGDTSQLSEGKPPPEARAASTADKLHNAQSMAVDYREMAERLWDRVNGSKDEQEWYYLGRVAGRRNRPG